MHTELFAAGIRVLDIACGRGRHAVAAAARGADVVAVDVEPDRLKQGDKLARQQRVRVEWITLDLARDPLPNGPFDVVMMFNYLDRARLAEFLRSVKPSGYFLGETFLEQQRDLGWGPTADAHLLKRGELVKLIAPLELVYGREVLEVIDGHPRYVSSIVARRTPE